MIKVKAKRQHSYDGKQRLPGQTYLCDERFLRVLMIAGAVDVVPVPDAELVENKRYNRRDVASAPVPAADAELVENKRYNRRDMRVKD